MTYFKRLLFSIVCIILCLAMTGVLAEGVHEVSLKAEQKKWSWESAGAATFVVYVSYEDMDLAGCRIEITAESFPALEDPGTVKITNIDGKRLKVKQQKENYTIPDGTPVHYLQLEGYWEPPLPEGEIRQISLHISAQSADGKNLGSTTWIKWYDPLENKMPGFLEYVGQTIPFCAGIILITVLLWLLCRKKGKPLTEKTGVVFDWIIVILFFVGVFLIPIHLRGPIFYRNLYYLSYLNFPFALAVILSFVKIRRWNLADIILYSVWVVSYLFVGYSNRELDPYRQTTVVFQNLIPFIILFYRMETSGKEKTVKLLLILFDIFVILLFIMCIEEKITGKHPFSLLIEWMGVNEYYNSEYIRYYMDPRSGFIWGHTLTNAVIFNTFYIVNALYFRSFKKRFILPVFFLITLGGVLLASSKTGIVVSILLLVFTTWKHKKWLLAIIPVLAGMYFLGAFNGIIDRFMHSSLTTGRIEGLTAYFNSHENPIYFLFGHGSNAVLEVDSVTYPYRAGFEFPPLMFAFDYGILFSAIAILGVYIYSSWRILRSKNWLAWFCYTVWYMEVNTYNGYALRNQDVLIFVNFMTMVILNLCDEMKSEGTKTDHGPAELKSRRRRRIRSEITDETK